MDLRLAGFLDRSELRPPIDSYDALAIRYATEAPSGNEEQIEDQLRELGYIEDEAAAAPRSQRGPRR